MPPSGIALARIYDTDQPAGYRVLVDRIWPRGISKARAGLDEWCRELAPSTELRQWYGHVPARWAEFQQRYRAELRGKKAEAHAMLARAGKKTIILLYGAKDREHNHAQVLRQFLAQCATSSKELG